MSVSRFFSEKTARLGKAFPLEVARSAIIVKSAKLDRRTAKMSTFFHSVCDSPIGGFRVNGSQFRVMF